MRLLSSAVLVFFFLLYLSLSVIFLSLLQVFVSSQTTFPVTDDLYLEGQTSGELSIDDEDGEDDDDGGSGSGDYGKEITELFCNCIFLYFNSG